MENNKSILDEVLNLPIGHSMDWKRGLITREIYRISETEFELTETVDGWYNAKVSLDKLVLILKGELELDTLNWY